MKKYIVHYIINGHILSVEVESDNLVSCAARAMKDYPTIKLDNILSITDKPFIQRVIGYVEARVKQEVR